MMKALGSDSFVSAAVFLRLSLNLGLLVDVSASALEQMIRNKYTSLACLRVAIENSLFQKVVPCKHCHIDCLESVLLMLTKCIFSLQCRYP